MHSYITLLQQACKLPIKQAEQDAGYSLVRAAVAQAGHFNLHGLVISAPEGVYSPHETSSTRFFMDNFGVLGLIPGKGKLLEIGCGAGAISILAAKHGWEVFAGDIDPVAVGATRLNAKTNGVELEARQSDLFNAFFGEQFDVILFNQPFNHVARPIEEDERTLTDTGGQLHIRFLEGAKKLLKPGGHVVFAYSNISNPAVFEQPGWAYELQAFDFNTGANMTRALFTAKLNND